MKFKSYVLVPGADDIIQRTLVLNPDQGGGHAHLAGHAGRRSDQLIAELRFHNALQLYLNPIFRPGTDGDEGIILGRRSGRRLFDDFHSYIHLC